METRPVTLVALVGGAGCGKSTFCRAAVSSPPPNCHVLHLELDLLGRVVLQQSRRKLLTHISEFLAGNRESAQIDQLRSNFSALCHSNSTVQSSLNLETFPQRVQTSFKKVACSDRHLCILLDDNHELASMRHNVLQVAAGCASFRLLYFPPQVGDIDAAACRLHNPVPPEVSTSLAARLEPPRDSELRYTTVAPRLESHLQLAALAGIFVETSVAVIATPVAKVPQLQAPRHLLDQVLRKCVGDVLRSAAGRDPDTKNLAFDVKCKILNDFDSSCFEWTDEEVVKERFKKLISRRNSKVEQD